MLRIISHRGNLHGPKSCLENSPEQIEKVLSIGLDCEIDLRFKYGKLYLGHDSPEFEISLNWLIDRNQFLWVHCKDFESLNLLRLETPDLNFFWHQEDSFTLTSKGFIWTFPGKQLGPSSIVVLPELHESDNSRIIDSIRDSFGVCTDYPMNYVGE